MHPRRPLLRQERLALRHHHRGHNEDNRPADIECARALGYKIKLLGQRDAHGAELPSPPSSRRTSSAAPRRSRTWTGVMNGISVRGDAVGEAMFFRPRRGAAHPTASAVAADIIDCVRDPKTRTYTGWWPSEPGYVTPPDKISCRWMLRTDSPLADIGRRLHRRQVHKRAERPRGRVRLRHRLYVRRGAGCEDRRDERPRALPRAGLTHILISKAGAFQ